MGDPFQWRVSLLPDAATDTEAESELTPLDEHCEEGVAGSSWRRLVHTFSRSVPPPFRGTLSLAHQTRATNETIHALARYPRGVRRLKFEFAGRDAENWAGHFGAQFACARLEVEPAGIGGARATADGGQSGAAGVAAVVPERPAFCELPIRTSFNMVGCVCRLQRGCCCGIM